MRHTILIATLSSVVASVLTTVVIGGSLFGAGTVSSANTPVETESEVTPGGVESIIQGDINCDGVVDAQDALGDLRYVAGLDVQQDEPCPDIGTLAAIPGPAGPQGEPGLSEVVYVPKVSAENSAPTRVEDADCPAGKVVIGGGASIKSAGSEDGLALAESWPVGDGSGWYARAIETGIGNPANWTLKVFAVCASVAE